MNVNWKGVLLAATTQFNDDQSLNLPATMKHLDAMIEGGIHGLIMLGTVGENCSLEYEENKDNPLADIRECVTVAKAAMKAVAES